MASVAKKIDELAGIFILVKVRGVRLGMRRVYMT